MSYYLRMALKGWFLLVVFLLMQAGSLASAACRPGATVSPETGAGCILEGCCCTEPGSSAPACACLEDPAGSDSPDPVPPVPVGGGRDLIASVGWVEWRACARPLRRPVEPRAVPRSDVRMAGRAAGPRALTVVYCALLI